MDGRRPGYKPIIDSRIGNLYIDVANGELHIILP